MLHNAFLEKYRKSDLVQYFNNMLEILTVERAEALKVAPQREALNEVMTRFNQSWQPDRGSELTPLIQELDVKRDTLFLGLKSTVEAWANYHYDAIKKNAAFLIFDKIDNLGTELHKKRYQQETALLNALIDKLNTDLQEEVTLLALSEWVVKLQEVNTLFNDKYIERVKALSGEHDGVVVELRKESIQVFRQLKAIFEARMAIAKVENSDLLATYDTVANELNEITEQYNDAVMRFVDKNKKEDEENTENS